MRVTVFLVYLYSSAKSEHQAKDASHGLCRLSEGISTAAIGAAKAHADTEELCKHKTNHALEGYVDGPGISNGSLPARFVLRDWHNDLGLGLFSDAWHVLSRKRSRTRVVLSVPRES